MLFSNYKFTTSSGKHSEGFSKTQIVSLIDKLETSSRRSDDLPMGFDHARRRRLQEYTSNKNDKGKFRVRFMSKDIFGSVEHQEKATHGLSYKLTLRRNENNVVLNKAVAIVDARIKIDNMQCYVPLYTHCIPH